MLFAGIDAGSRAIKVALYDSEHNTVVGRGVMDQGVAQAALARELYDNVLSDCGAGVGEVAGVVATVYGRNAVPFAQTTITEITCHARGVRYYAPETMTILEIGGQDSKVIRLDDNGAVRDFAMNDRCAAGTGRFMEIVANRMGTSLPELNGLPVTNGRAVAISSMCVVFAETEIIGLLASGAPPAEIVAGVHAAVAQRVAALACRTATCPIVFTGGVALIPGMTRALETAFGQPVTALTDPQMTGAVGAAILASRQKPR